MISPESEFEREMFDIYHKAKKECHYIATRYLQMLEECGGLLTAKKLLADKKIHEGFVNLYLLGRKDLTVEYLVIQEKYQNLFTKEEIKTAKSRLI